MRTPLLAALAVAVAVAVAAAVLLRGGESLRLHATFADAGQLVRGGEVQVAGRRVGVIAALDVTRDGMADVELDIGDDSVLPLREGTRARIRAVGQAGVANRFVELEPGPASAPELRDGARLAPDRTTGIVDLDALLDALDGPARKDLQELIGRSAEVYAGSGAEAFAGMLERLDPASGAFRRMAQELAYDERALASLVRSGRAAATALASRDDDLTGAVEETARTFGALADERRALGEALDGSPAFLRKAAGTLDRVRGTTRRLRPALREAAPALAALRPVLRETPPTLRRADPVLADLRGQLPALRRTLDGFRRLAEPASTGLRELGKAVKASAPIVRGVRIYGADFALGVTNGLAGIITSNFNHAGHYARLNFVENPQTLLSGLPASWLSSRPLVPGLFGSRTGVTALCPGANQPPAPDGSNPYVPDPSLCDPSLSMPASVNEP